MCESVCAFAMLGHVLKVVNTASYKPLMGI